MSLLKDRLDEAIRVIATHEDTDQDPALVALRRLVAGVARDVYKVDGMGLVDSFRAVMEGKGKLYSIYLVGHYPLDACGQRSPKIATIKAVRDALNTSLKEAKAIVDDCNATGSALLKKNVYDLLLWLSVFQQYELSVCVEELKCV
jgi:hypothetical protein